MAKNKFEIRELKEQDIANMTELLLRLKRLNGEFDSIFNVAEGAEATAKKHLKAMVEDKESRITYVVDNGEKVVGILSVHIIPRNYYLPDMEARIVEFYIMPEARRSGMGSQLMDKMYTELRNRGVKLITAEFPALNPIALNFYKQLDFRELVQVYGKVL